MASGSPPKYEYLKPSAIRFTQDSIARRFPRTNHTLEKTLEMLLEKGMLKREVPMIRVVQRDRKWWSLDNRRLWVFRELEKKGGCKIIKVQVVSVNETEWKRKFTTKNDGKSVSIRETPEVAGGGYSDGDEDLV